MPLLKPLCPMLLFAASMLFVTGVASAGNPPPPDFSGIWRLDDQHSDNAVDIATRLRAEIQNEKAPMLPAGVSSAAAPANQASNQHSGHGGHGMGGSGAGGGHGHGDSGKSTDSSSDDNSPVALTPPPLLDKDSVLNVQQDAKGVQVGLDNSDRLAARLDGVAQQSLGGNAIVQSQLTALALQITMKFDGGVQLKQTWVKSPDGHHLTVTELWTTPAARQPITFTRSYDRLDI